MNQCEFCGYTWADCDENGVPITLPYCHFSHDSDWQAPCEEEEEWVDIFAQPYDYQEF